MIEKPIRHPEPELEVVWQRHLPAGFGTRPGESVEYVAAVEHTLHELMLEILGKNAFVWPDGDMVITLSKRPQ